MLDLEAEEVGKDQRLSSWAQRRISAVSLFARRL